MNFNKLIQGLFVLALLFITATQVDAQSLLEAEVSESVGTWEYMSGGSYVTRGDDGYGYVPFGFTINYDNRNYTYGYATTNGVFYFGTGSGMYRWYSWYPGYSRNFRLIGIGACDLYSYGGIYRRTDGPAGSRVCTVEYRRMAWGCYGYYYYNYLQIKFYEGSNLIQLIFGPPARYYSSSGCLFFAGDNYRRYINIRPGNPSTYYYSDRNPNTGSYVRNTYQQYLPVGKTYQLGAAEPKIVGVYPAATDPNEPLIIRRGYQYPDLDELHPAVHVERDASWAPVTVKYKISGPLPAQNNPDFKVIYEATQEGDISNNEVTPNPQPVGKPGIYYFTHARGVAANTDPDNDGSLDLRSTDIPGGRYLVESWLMFDDKEQKFDDQYFQIALEDDISVLSVQSPKPMDQKKYPMSAGRIAVQTTVGNMGINDVTSFDCIAEIFNSDDDLIYRDSVRWDNDLDPLSIGEKTRLDGLADFRPNAIGTYRLELYADLLSAVDDEERNNYYPRQGNESYHFIVAHEIEAQADSIIDPSGDEIYVGRPVRPKAAFSNQGVSDISDVPGSMFIVQLATGDTVYRSNIIIQDIPSGRVNWVVVAFDDIFIPPDAGDYQVCVSVNSPDDPVTENNSVCSTFEVIHALAGVYTIGELNRGDERNFNTVDEALNALYLQGMTASVVFEFTDAEYEVGDIQSPDPAIDLTSMILGLNDERTLTFRAARNRAHMRGGVTLNLATSSGIGVLLGQSIVPSNSFAPLHIVTEGMKRYYANSPGYITFDGGTQRALRIALRTDNDFRAGFYLSQGASNCQVKNCLIEGGVNQAASLECMLPLTVFNQTQSRFQFQEDLRDNGDAYSTGILLRSIAPRDAKGDDNINNIDTLKNMNNLIQGNEISGFGYGIVSLGVGMLFKQVDAVFESFYNEDNVICDNIIHDVARAGIFLGFENNSIIRNNRIYDITGDCGNDAAGIIAGGGHDRDYFAYNNVGLEIDGNEISGIQSDEFVYGVKVEQGCVTLQNPSGTIENFPKDPENMDIKNNMIWGLTPSDADANIAGIRLFTIRESNPDANVEMITPEDPNYFSRGDKICNNTVIISDDGGTNNTGAIAGIAVQQVSGAMLYNNAIALLDNSIDANNMATTAIFYHGQMPEEGGLLGDRNAFWLGNSGGSIYRFIQTDDESNILEMGDRNEFATLDQWQLWTGGEANSVVGNFTTDLQFVGNEPFECRMITNPAPVGSILDNRGDRLSGVESDIDGNYRGTAGQRYDIGAFEFDGQKYVSDVEIVSVPTPGAYKSGNGTFNDAEYIMTTSPVDVKTRIRNNGSIQQSDIKVYVRIYRELPNGMFDETPEVEETVLASIASTESVNVDFNLADELGEEFEPATYADLRPDYIVPDHFSTMEANVTPKYKIEVSVESDQNNANNISTKEVRFYIQKSPLKLLISSENSFADLYYSGTPTADQIAGRLNADSLYAGLKRLGWYTDIDQERYDIDHFDRKGWEPKSVNYTMYRSLFWTDGDDKALTRYEKLDIEDFLNVGNDITKKNIVIGSQEMVRSNSMGNDYDPDFLQTILRSEYQAPGNPLGSNVSNDGNSVMGITIGRDLTEDIMITGYEDDMPPYCGVMSLYDEGEGLAQVAYGYVNHDASPDNNTMGVATTSLTKNIVNLGVDWRHWSNMERLLRSVLDYLDRNGGDVVPIELSEFNADAVGQRVDLSWATASELNSAMFEVEKAEMSESGRSAFVKIDEVEAAGKSAVRREYGPVSDFDVTYGGTYVYRLKLIDNDGNYKYSDEKVVTLEGQAGYISLGEAKPNPAIDVVKLDLVKNADTKVEITLYDMSGKPLDTQITIGERSLEIDLKNISNGSYTLVLRSGDVVITRQIRVVK